MSIETEKWRRRTGLSYGGSSGVDIVRVEQAEGGGEVETWVADTDYPDAVEVLPEALALLKRLDRRGGLGQERHEAIQDILRRAGVLK